MNGISRLKVVKVNGPVVVGITAITPSAGVDTRGYEGVLFIADFGAIASDSTTVLKAQQSDDAGVGDGYSDLLGSGVAIAANADDKLAYLEIHAPAKRYVLPVITRTGGSTGSVLNSLIAILYGPNDMPVTQLTASVSTGEFHQTPAEGTA